MTDDDIRATVAAAIATTGSTLCESCRHTWDVQRGRPRLVPGVFAWTCYPAGNTIPLCADCHEAWLRVREAEPDIGAVSIASLT